MGKNFCVIQCLGTARLLRHAMQLPCHVFLAPMAQPAQMRLWVSRVVQ